MPGLNNVKKSTFDIDDIDIKIFTYEQELILSLEHLCSLRLSTAPSDTAMRRAASRPALATLSALTGDPAVNACNSSITTGTARLLVS